MRAGSGLVAAALLAALFGHALGSELAAIKKVHRYAVINKVHGSGDADDGPDDDTPDATPANNSSAEVDTTKDESTTDDGANGNDTPMTAFHADPLAQHAEQDARHSREAAETAAQAANVANAVAAHSIKITHHAQSALHHARDALHGARVDSQGLSDDQRESLRIAEEKLRRATQKTDYGKVKTLKDGHEVTVDVDVDAERTDRQDSELRKLQYELDTKEDGKSVSTLREELRALRKKLATKRSEGGEVDTMGTLDTSDDVSAGQYEQELRDLEKLNEKIQADKAEGKDPAPGDPTEDEVKARMEEIRYRIDKLEAKEEDAASMREKLRKLEELRKLQEEEERLMHERGQPGADVDAIDAKLEKLRAREAQLEGELGGHHYKDKAETDAEIKRLRKLLGEEVAEDLDHDESGALKYKIKGKQEVDEDMSHTIDLDKDTKVKHDSDRSVNLPQDKGIDVDTEMPYGELEPFGREDTAQELTEESIRQSDEMVDQLERAEVAEEKRSVFRALTRLRGAAITSYDGVARAQTGNIDEYNKVHQWRVSHPLHHLADEESDISKWAFPDNADLIQMKKKAPPKGPHRDLILEWLHKYS